MDTFTKAYIEAALFSSLDEYDQPLDAVYTIEDFAPEALQQMAEDCRAFQEAWPAAIALDRVRAGQDFWLTRNHHGAGFWDGDWPEVTGRLLTEAAHAYGSQDLYIGDDGNIYCQ